MASQPLCEEMLIESVLSVLASKKTVKDVYEIESELCQQATLSVFFTKRETPKEPNACPICLEDLKSSLCILGCGHVFHSKCEETWRQNSETCATCRKEVTVYGLVRDTWANFVNSMAMNNVQDAMTRAKQAMDECKTCGEKETSDDEFVDCDHIFLAV